MSRFKQYSNISSCDNFTEGSYVIANRYQVEQLNMSQECPNMVLILDPHVSKYYYASTIGSLAYYNTFDSVLYKVVK